jgi:hypothetical protein
MNELVAAVDAALALEAGKYVIFQLGRPTLARVLTARFSEIDGPDTATAKARLGGFLRNLETRATENSDLPPSRLQQQFTRPEITATLYDAFEGAMETDEPLKQDALADLVIARLRAPDESVDGPAARIAINRLRDVTSRQLRLLGFIAFFQTDWSQGTWDSVSEDLRENYIAWLAHMAKPFEDLHTDFGDFSHLRGLGLLNFADSEGFFTTSSTPPAAIPAFMRFSDVPQDPRVKRVLAQLSAAASGDLRRTQISYAASSTLTPAGALIADSVLHTLTEPAPPLAPPPKPNTALA